jgi:hypothetical protein
MRDALPPLPEKTIKQFTDHKDLGFIQVSALTIVYVALLARRTVFRDNLEHLQPHSCCVYNC